MSTTIDSPPVLAPGVSASTLAAALARFAAEVGDAHVRTGEDVRGHTDPYAFGDGVGSVPAAVVLPGSVAEVQAVVRIAADLSVPLWTVSRGRNLAYGGASPRVPGSVVLDLSRMNRVLEVDEEAGYARVEPGVSFGDLHAHLRSLGSSLWMSVPELSWGSVIGNALERGFGYTVGGDHSAHVCGMEVVLADGSLLRTGMGAMAGNEAWSLYKGGFGPSLDGLFLQSNYGVVTSMGVWLHPAPETAVMMSVAVPSYDDLAPLVDTLRPFLLDGTIRSTATIGSVLALASAVTERNLWYDGPGAMPEPIVEKMRSVFGVGRWNARVGFYGSEEVTAAQARIVRRACERIPGAVVGVRTYPGTPPDDVHPADRTLLGVPSTDMVRMAGWHGGDPAHIDFSLVCPPKGRDALAQARLIGRRVNEYGFDHVGGLTMFGRHAVTLSLLSFDRSNADQRQAVEEVFGHLVADAAAQHYAPYRAHVAFMDVIADQYGWGDHAARRVQQTIKDALDPRGILSPGKQGIWPSARIGADDGAHR